MKKSLVIVESPAKGRTIKKYLDDGFEVLATHGHIRELHSGDDAINVENDFSMIFELVDKNRKYVDIISTAIKNTDTLYLATDPDREGETIAWHLIETLKENNLLEDVEIRRVVCQDLSEKGIRNAIKHPRELSPDLIHAQLARRAFNYLIGFNLSPLLWKKIHRGLSAGRTQSPALRMIVEREQEIENFEAKEYWSIEADLGAGKQEFSARLYEFKGKKIQPLEITCESDVSKIENDIIKVATGKLAVRKIEQTQINHNPSAPFTSSTLLQEASDKLGFAAHRTMHSAQQLYEGVNTGEGEIGLVTYTRTESADLSSDATTAIREFIATKYGKEYLPEKPNSHTVKPKILPKSQEAIRPTSIALEPDTIKNKLTADQYKIYTLIWKRTVACQMIHSTTNTINIDLETNNAMFRASSSFITEPGFTSIYEKTPTDNNREAREDRILATLKEGDTVDLINIRSQQYFTEPPPRYTEASLINSLEEHNIGRPSSYATIISGLQQREYVEMERRRFIPTDIGRVVNKFLTTHFPQYVDYDTAAQLENKLDAVARGEKDWLVLMKEFWIPFKALIDEKMQSVDRKEITQELIDEKCPHCGEQLAIRLGRLGRFIGCSAFPGCDYTRNLDDEKELSEPKIIEDRRCPECNSGLIIRQGRYGKFIGCSNYPDCKHIEPVEKPEETGVKCPECKKGDMLQRHTRHGKIFYSCSRFPSCKYAVSNEPIHEPCPQCNWPILTIRTSKRKGTEKVCPQKKCSFSASYEKEDVPEKQ